MFENLTAWLFAVWPYLSLLAAMLAVGWAQIESAEATRARKEAADARGDARYWMRVAQGLERLPRLEESLPRRTS